MALDIKLHPKQLLALNTPATEVLYGGAVGGGKALDVHTPILTTCGWKTMETLVVGDRVFDELGLPCNVVAKSKVDKKSATYEVEFDGNKDKVVACDGRHQWSTLTRTDRTAKIERFPTPKTTNEIRHSLTAERGKRNNHSIQVTEPLQFVEKLLDIDPYILGVFLGGGMYDRKAKKGMVITSKCASTTTNLATYKGGKYYDKEHWKDLLKIVGLYGLEPRDHFIPIDYQLGSVAQRTELLKGMLDVRGTIYSDSFKYKRSAGQVEMYTDGQQLCKDVHFMLLSLGQKSWMYEREENNRKRRPSCAWRVRVYADMILFNSRDRATQQRHSMGSIRTARQRHYISDVRKVEKRAVQCIQVDSPSNCYLAGEYLIPTHNSYLMRVASIVWAMEVPGIQIYLFRLTQKELDDNHMVGSGGYYTLLLDAVHSKYVKINSSKNIIQFRNGKHNSFMGGSIIHLCHCQHEDDKYLYKGAEMDVLMIDEATHFTHTKYEYLRTRVRRPKDNPLPDAVIKKYGEKYFPRILLGTNPGGISHCVRFGNVLTTKGFVPIQDVVVGDMVLSMNADTFDIERNKVTETFEYDYTGNIVHIDNKKINIECTPNHSIAYIPDPKKNKYFKMKPFTELPNQANVVRAGNKIKGGSRRRVFKIADEYHLKQQRANQPLKIKYRDYAELMGWVLSEGFFVADKKYGSPRFAIAQSKKNTRLIIEDLLDRCGFTYNYHSQAYTMYSYEWAHYIKQFGKCEDKFIPRELLNSTDIDAVFTSLMLGDGHWITDESGNYSTYSTRLRDDVMELCVKLGYTVHYTIRQQEDRRLPTQVVHFHKTKQPVTEIFTGNKRYKNRKEVTVHDSNCSEEYVENEKIYCIEVENNHNFFLEQNGHVWLSGNSFWRREFVKIAEPMTITQMPNTKGGMLRQFIPAQLSDNPSIDKEEYEGKVMGVGNEATVRMLLEGDWDAVAGGMFDDVWDETVHMIPPFEIPYTWYCDRSFDWGHTDPFSVGWWAQSDGSSVKLADTVAEDGTVVKGETVVFPKGSLFRIAEWYGWTGEENIGIGLTAYEIGQGIAKMERTNDVLKNIEKIVPGPGDHQVWNNSPKQDSSYRSLIHELNSGYYGNDHYMLFDIFTKADQTAGSRPRGWDILRTHLKNSVNYPKIDRPCLFVFNTCPTPNRILPTLIRHDKKIEDIADHLEDHVADEIRYRVQHSVHETKRIPTRVG